MRKKLKKLDRISKLHNHNNANLNNTRISGGVNKHTAKSTNSKVPKRTTANHKKYKSTSSGRISYTDNLQSSRKYSSGNKTIKTSTKILWGVLALLLILAIIIGSRDEHVNMFSGKEYLKSLDVDTNYGYTEEYYKTYPLHKIDGYAMGMSDGDGIEKRYRFCVEDHGKISYDVELTSSQVSIESTSIDSDLPLVDVYKRRYKNRKGIFVDTYYYKIHCSPKFIKVFQG